MNRQRARMPSNKTKYAVTLAGLFFAGWLANSAYSMQTDGIGSEQKLNRQVVINEVRGELPFIFTTVLNSAHFSGGMVSMRQCPATGETASYLFPAMTGSTKSALDSLASLNQNYRWELHNDAINLLPRSDGPKFLDVKVKDFVINKPRMSVDSSVGELLKLPEVKRALAEMKLKESELSVIVGWSSTNPSNLVLEAHDLTVREALNEIAKAKAGAVWHYSESHCNAKNLFSITWISR